MNLLRKCALAALIASCTTLSAIDIRTDLNIVGGYRNDELQRINIIEFYPPTVTEIDKIRIDNINIGQVGLQGRLMMPRCEPCWCEDFAFINNFYLAGFALWGWGGSGTNLHEREEDFTAGLEVIGRAKLSDAQTEDYQIGLGYLFDFGCWGVGISGGYSYDQQEIRTKHGAFTTPTFSVEVAGYGKGYKTKTTWKGPWIGAQLFRDWCSWTFGLGYEYHWADYTAKHRVPNNPTAQAEGFIADNTKSHQGFGNIVFVDSVYHFCNCWEVGAGFRYQYWEADHCRLTPAGTSFAQLGFPVTTKARAIGKWISWSINFNLGYSF